MVREQMLDPGLYNMDCMEGMKLFPDKYFDLAIVDPPYGIGVMTMTYTKSGAIRPGFNGAAKRRDYRKQGQWDVKPGKEYFDELFRVSKKQIIWGGNYFSDILPPSKSYVIWDKRVTSECTNKFADCEYAWLSNGMGVARIYHFLWNGMLQGNMKSKEDRFHPTQKPVSLYQWLIETYAKPGYKILDTHAGSASSLIACHRAGLDGWGFEIDKEYYDKAAERLNKEKAQINMFTVAESEDPGEQITLL